VDRRILNIYFYYFAVFRVEVIHFRAIRSCRTIGFVTESKMIRWTRAAARIQQENKMKKKKDNVIEDNVEDNVIKNQTMPVCLHFFIYIFNNQ